MVDCILNGKPNLNPFLCRQHLADVGVPLAVDSPGVGRNLKDHIMTGLMYECKAGENGFSDVAYFSLASHLLKYAMFGGGMFAQSWISAVAFFKSTAQAEKDKRQKNHSKADAFEDSAKHSLPPSRGLDSSSTSSVSPKTAAVQPRTSPTLPNDLQIHFVPMISHDEDQIKENMGIDPSIHASEKTRPKNLPPYGVSIVYVYVCVSVCVCDCDFDLCLCLVPNCKIVCLNLCLPGHVSTVFSPTQI